MKIVVATGNQGKMREIKSIFNNFPCEILSMKEAGLSTDVEETGTTFEENALLKARALAGTEGVIVLADDSGLEIDYLNKEPGIYSARFMGEDTSYDIKNASLIAKLENVPFEERTARFVCAVAAVCPDGTEFVTRATMEGYIGYEPKGENGFGYDPILYIKEYDCMSAELSMEAKNEISHRGKAFREMAAILAERINFEG